jgi:Asp-tRNA(Asn)/Glu-tRNA(Gln) amidotransferase A subunit family amidase
MGWTAYDVAIGFLAMAGPTVPLIPQPVVGSLKTLKVGIYLPFFTDADPRIVHLSREALDKLTARGARTIDIEIPHLEYHQFSIYFDDIS